MQSSCLGTLKQRLVALEASGRSFKISKWEPTTKLCPQCGAKNVLSLDERIYRCKCGYEMDRDIHSARLVLMIGSSKRAECLEQASMESGPLIPNGNCVSARQVRTVKSKQEAAAFRAAVVHVRFMMEKFGLDEEKARMAIEKGFRVEAILDGSAMSRLMVDTGISGRVDRMKRETSEILNHAEESL